MNELVFIISGIIGFFGVALSGRLFGKIGLISWVAISTILANIAVAKQIHMFGMDVTLGNIMFSSTYLATDILTEVYGKKEAKKAVFIGLFSAVVFVVSGILLNALRGNGQDGGGTEALQFILSFSIRVTTASIICFFVSNLADVWLFEKFREKSEKNLWLRNNVCTIFCNGAENFLFMFIGLYGFYDAKTCVLIALAGWVIEIICGLLDTPFVYLGRKWARKHEESPQLVGTET